MDCRDWVAGLPRLSLRSAINYGHVSYKRHSRHNPGLSLDVHGNEFSFRTLSDGQKWAGMKLIPEIYSGGKMKNVHFWNRYSISFLKPVYSQRFLPFGKHAMSTQHLGMHQTNDDILQRYKNIQSFLAFYLENLIYKQSHHYDLLQNVNFIVFYKAEIFSDLLCIIFYQNNSSSMNPLRIFFFMPSYC